MKNLISLIFQEFEKAGYRSSGKNLWKHKNYKDFWIVVEVNGDYVLEDLQSRFYNDFSEVRKEEPEMEKNTSLLILNKVDRAGKNLERIIADENDVYVFKKYVIQYTEDEWESIKTLFESGDDSISNLLMRTDLFNTLKKNYNSPLGLLYNIGHKLPFVTMDVTKKDYVISEELHVPEELESVLKWVDSIPKREGKTPTEAEIDAVKKLIEKEITEEISTKDENTENTPS